MTEDDMEPTAEYITMGELANKVGVSTRTIQRLRRRGIFPPGVFVEVGSWRIVRVNWPAFQKWLQAFDGILRDPAPRRSPEPPKPEGDDKGPGLRILR